MSAQQKSFWGGSIVTGLMMIIFTGLISWGGVNIQENRDARVKMPMLIEKFDVFAINQTLHNDAILTGIEAGENKMDSFLVFLNDTNTRVTTLEVHSEQCREGLHECKDMHNAK